LQIIILEHLCWMSSGTVYCTSSLLAVASSQAWRTWTGFKQRDETPLNVCKRRHACWIAAWGTSQSWTPLNWPVMVV